ncbi:hypothetical protein H3C70_05525 [Patescibacteria group bacterium]|nr:hypothetical protein [Patescibacteria group bacterium]
MSERFLAWVVFYGALFLLSVAGIAFFLPGRGLLLPYFTPKPETFSELYFEDHLELPKRITPNTPYQFSFTIRNHEGKTMIYPLEVFATSETTPSSQLVLLKTELELQNEEERTVPVDYTLHD